ncbi:hypothetical protein Rhe02_01490 [Rhizocola hellebori]|uniref:Uncharacterized protein n=1 Tax=Rhizocola hellebori TaxID=1392758 RepID=A0A8J3VD07_9ACTN|nr:hypothetical protein [Rhizocola hellebori]GIH02082.1 hypothetical protein Rhe02_01490 [Rhizocola hellebori]
MEEALEDRRRAALMALLCAGISPPPTKAQMVEALAAARRSVASHRSRHQPLDAWLRSEEHGQGMRENAAVLAALEIPELRDEVAARYVQAHPERQVEIDALLEVL